MRIPFFNPWMLANPTMPKMYWEVKSQEQLIANLYCIMDALKDTLNDDIEQTNANTDAIEQIQKTIDSIENGEYLDKYIDGLGEYIDENLIAFVGRLAAYVFPEFYWDGSSWRFALVIPEDWTWLKFSFPFVDDPDENDCSFHISLVY